MNIERAKPPNPKKHNSPEVLHFGAVVRVFPILDLEQRCGAQNQTYSFAMFCKNVEEGQSSPS